MVFNSTYIVSCCSCKLQIVVKSTMVDVIVMLFVRMTAAQMQSNVRARSVIPTLALIQMWYAQVMTIVQRKASYY